MGETLMPIRRQRPIKNRLRRSMMFLNAQNPALLKDAYIFGADSLILDLEDAVAENQKDAARFSLYHALTTIDYGNTEVLVRINGLDTPHWQEDIRVAVAGGADGIRIAKCESAKDVQMIEAAVLAAEKEFGKEEGRTLLMAALESPLGILNALEICMASDRLFGVAIAGGDFRKSMRVGIEKGGIEINTARGLILLAARAAGVQCYDTNYPRIEDMEGYREEVELARKMGFDGKSIINPRQISLVHELFAPTKEEIAYSEKLLRSMNEQLGSGIGVYTVDGKMVDKPFFEEAQRIIDLAKLSGVYYGEM
ncbi:putative citrate (pro-3S)-lyase, beta subunit [Streptococcus pseudoporcinus LQ 940-04]|uniref:Citrate (Pro-3S)-lyase, beta subunit n=2 Tax=Streptococcus pseudoporcinus TaxID=361101 RepID=G5K7Q3_9STRE|nr:putative citrate (pro-3S)-lyase, beta subunit [Streptococcus pseudoporcinus SPIN 20026]EHI65406.1 putative citrate (pro-3S)-lyase, beta subunit [Streptococcus pseudoporcinus LQ 940-04]